MSRGCLCLPPGYTRNHGCDRPIPGRLDGPSPSHPEAYDFDIMAPTTAFEGALPAQTARVGMEVEGDQVWGREDVAVMS